jgi:virulence factor
MIDTIRAQNPLPIIVLGTGGITQKAYYPLLTQWKDIRICGIYSRTKEHMQAACARWDIPFGSTEIEEILHLGAKAAFLLTNKKSHFEMAKILLENGLDVYLEKPFTETSRQALELANLAKRSGRILMVGYNRRYSRLYRKAKEIMNGKLIQTAIVQKHRAQPHYSSLQEAYLEDIIHQIDLLRFLCGEVQPIQTKHEMKNGVLQGAVSTFQLAGGGLGMLITSHTAGTWQESASLHGEQCSVHVNAFHDLTVHYDDHEEIFGTDREGKWIPDLQERGFIPEIEHFLHCIQTRQQPDTNAEEAYKTQLLYEQLVSE